MPAGGTGKKKPEKFKALDVLLGARPSEPGPLKSSTYYLTDDQKQRIAAVVRGQQVAAYGQDVEGHVPDNVSELVRQAVDIYCTAAEDKFNNGKRFPPAKISVGPGPSGARAGAQKRAADRAAAKAAAGTGRK